MRLHARRAAIWAGHGLFKGAALVAAFALIVIVWLQDAALLTETADLNLRVIKTATGMLPGDWPGKVESALRLFGADRALLLTEAVLLAKLAMAAIGYPFVLAGRGLRARWRRHPSALERTPPAENRPRSIAVTSGAGGSRRGDLR